MSQTLCQSSGHDWKTTVSSTYRTCRRADCRAAERLVNGSWIDAAPRQPTRAQHGPVPASSPSLLWNADLYDTLHTGWPPPGYDETQERRMEQRYHTMIAEEQRYRAQRTGRGGAPCK